MVYQTQNQRVSQPVNIRLALFALLFGALVLSGCGAKKTARSAGSIDSASRYVQGEAAYCNTFSGIGTKLDGKIQTYLLPNGDDAPDFMRMKITGINEDFVANSNYVLKFFRAEGLPDTNTVRIDETPLEVRFEAAGGIMVSGYMNNVSMIDVSNIRSAHGISGTSATDFFNKVDIIVSNVDYRWDVLIVALYENTSATESRLVGEARMLMPAFTADPNQYASDHPSILHELHPFWSQRSSRTADFAAMSDSFCW